MKKTYADWKKDMRIGDVVKYNNIEFTVSVLIDEEIDSVLEVISQAPRQVLTWAWAKERVDRWPENIYGNRGELIRFNFGNSVTFNINYDNGNFSHAWDSILGRSLFTEKPLPQLIELVEETPMPVIDWSKAPKNANYHAIDEDGNGYWYMKEPEIMNFASNSWHHGSFERNLDIQIGYFKNWKNSLQQRPVEEDPWVEITKDTNVKMPCEAILYNLKGFEGKAQLIKIDKDCICPFQITDNWEHCGYYNCKVRKSSIIVDNVEDDVRRIWIIQHASGTIQKTNTYYTKKELLKNYTSLDAYCPAEEVPSQDKWRKA